MVIIKGNKRWLVISLLDVEAMGLDGVKSSHPELLSAGSDCVWTSA